MRRCSVDGLLGVQPKAELRRRLEALLYEAAYPLLGNNCRHAGRQEGLL